MTTHVLARSFIWLPSGGVWTSLVAGGFDDDVSASSLDHRGLGLRSLLFPLHLAVVRRSRRARLGQGTAELRGRAQKGASFPMIPNRAVVLGVPQRARSRSVVHRRARAGPQAPRPGPPASAAPAPRAPGVATTPVGLLTIS